MTRSLRIVLGLSLAVLAGCPAPSPSSGSASWASGSRLRARVERAESGAMRFVGWHDTLLDVDCTLARDTTGTIRCLPATTFLNPVFRDAACEQPAHLASTCDSSTRFAVVNAGSAASIACDAEPLTSQLEVHALDTTSTVTADYFYGASTTCAASGQPAGLLVPDLGVVDPSTFVEGTMTREPLAGRLRAEVVITADGAREVVAFYDPTLGRHCDPTALGPFSVDACMPWPSIGFADVIPWRSDASCARAIGHAGTTACPAVAILRTVRDADGCVRSPELDAPGALVAQPVFEGLDATHCAPVDERPTDRFVEIGPPLDQDVLVRTTTTRRGMDALRLVESTYGGASLGGLSWELPSGESCWPRPSVDGRSRCLPTFTDLDVPSAFADAACTDPLYETSRCSAPHFGARTHAIAGCTGAPDEIDGLEPASPTAIFVRDAAGTCIADVLGERLFVRAGSALPAEAFPLLETIVE